MGREDDYTNKETVIIFKRQNSYKIIDYPVERGVTKNLKEPKRNCIRQGIFEI